MEIQGSEGQRVYWNCFTRNSERQEVIFLSQTENPLNFTQSL